MLGEAILHEGELIGPALGGRVADVVHDGMDDHEPHSMGAMRKIALRHGWDSHGGVLRDGCPRIVDHELQLLEVITARDTQLVGRLALSVPNDVGDRLDDG